MSSTITALFDTRAEAEAARDRLASSGFSDVNIHDKTSAGFRENAYSDHQDRGFWDSVKNAFLPDEDRHTYEEGVRRGGTLLTADVDDSKIDDVVRILEESNSIDIDDRSQQWKSSGWNYDQGKTGAAMGGAAAGAATGASGLFGGNRSDADLTDRQTKTAMGERGDREEVIPIVEEQLVVGKREVSRGSARVRSYVCETPVHEQVRLREERINVERRPVDQPLSAAEGDAFRERSIDVSATGEEAVVAKNARVVEEVVVSKTAEERTEEVSDTVRRTQVDIDRDGDRATGRESMRDADLETDATGNTLGTSGSTGGFGSGSGGDRRF